ncbi:MAG TPA: DUF1700 domain-containing protein [Firmicutes bacterium]|nr:DUF1700 domain-containing protein [Bacillota bacterium]
MIAEMEREMEKYLKEIHKSLTCSEEQKRKILEGVRNGIHDYLDRNPGASIEEIREHFGDPAQIAQETIADLTPKDVRRFTGRARKAAVIAAALGVVAIIAAVVCYFTLSEFPGALDESDKYEVSSTAPTAIVETY